MYRYGRFETRKAAKDFCTAMGIDQKRITKMGEVFTIATGLSAGSHLRFMSESGLDKLAVIYVSAK